MRAFIAGLLLTCTPSIGWGHDGNESRLEILNLLIYVSPRNGLLYFQRAELERSQSQWHAARSDYDRALQLNPELQAPLLGKAFALLGEGEAGAAYAMFESFLLQMPGNVEAVLGRARCLDKLHKPAESAAAFTDAIHLLTEPRPENFLERFHVLLQAGLKSEAMASLDEGVRTLGPLVSLQLPAIELALDLKRYDDAVTRLTWFVKNTPRPETWLARRADVYEQMGRATDARNDRVAAIAAIDLLPRARTSDRSTISLLNGLKGKIN